jgi:hypothetical protein
MSGYILQIRFLRGRPFLVMVDHKFYPFTPRAIHLTEVPSNPGRSRFPDMSKLNSQLKWRLVPSRRYRASLLRWGEVSEAQNMTWTECSVGNMFSDGNSDANFPSALSVLPGDFARYNQTVHVILHDLPDFALTAER